MRLVKRVAILAASLAGLAGAALVTAQAAAAHDDDDHGWKHKHWRHQQPGPWFVEPAPRYYYYRAPPVVYERPVIYRDVPAYSYYPPGPPSLNINIPLR